MKKIRPACILYRILSLALAIAVLCPAITGLFAEEAFAASKKITLKAARSMALHASSKYESALNEVESKKAAKDSALKAIKAKQKNLSTFRWSPLLNFKFPEKPDFSEASEFEFKPLALSSDISVAQHKLQDTVFEINQQVNDIYVDIVTAQETIAFQEDSLEVLNEGIAHNKARLKMGEANQSDIDRQEKKVQTLTDSIASQRRTLEANLKKFSDMIGFDVTTGYVFERPYVEAEIERSMLPSLISYTEDRDENYYEACQTAATARQELKTNYGLMKNKYGNDIGMISGHVNNALNGLALSASGFKKDYKAFLEKIDSYWQGKKKICLFIKIPRLWMKGSLDGIRYIEDDPYVLYQNAIDYAGARKDEEAARKELDRSVEDSFNQYISVKNAYIKAQKDLNEMAENMKAYSVKNRMGLMTFEEYQDAEEEYEALQNGMLDSMSLYTKTLYSFDRLTCGGVSALLSGTDSDMQTAVVGESYVEKDSKEARYYLTAIIQRQMFELSVYIPEDFPVTITDFELWCDNVMIGQRTAADGSLRAIALEKEKVDKVFIRLYNGSEFVDDCVIDPQEESGILNIVTAMNVNKDETGDLGTYNTVTSDITGLMSLDIVPLPSENIAYFRILTEDGIPFGDGSLISIDKSFTHLGLVSTDLSELKIELYGKDEALLYQGRFDTVNKKIKKNEE